MYQYTLSSPHKHITTEETHFEYRVQTKDSHGNIFMSVSRLHNILSSFHLEAKEIDGVVTSECIQLIESMSQKECRGVCKCIIEALTRLVIQFASTDQHFGESLKTFCEVVCIPVLNNPSLREAFIAGLSSSFPHRSRPVEVLLLYFESLINIFSSNVSLQINFFSALTYFMVELDGDIDQDRIIEDAMFCKLSKIMDLLIQWVISNQISVDIVIDIYQEVVLRVLNPQVFQNFFFFLFSSDKNSSERFVVANLKICSSSNSPDLLRTSSVKFLASFLWRAKVLDSKFVSQCLEYLVDILNRIDFNFRKELFVSLQRSIIFLILRGRGDVLMEKWNLFKFLVIQKYPQSLAFLSESEKKCLGVLPGDIRERIILESFSFNLPFDNLHYSLFCKGLFRENAEIEANSGESQPVQEDGTTVERRHGCTDNFEPENDEDTSNDYYMHPSNSDEQMWLKSPSFVPLADECYVFSSASESEDGDDMKIRTPTMRKPRGAANQADNYVLMRLLSASNFKRGL